SHGRATCFANGHTGCVLQTEGGRLLARGRSFPLPDDALRWAEHEREALERRRLDSADRLIHADRTRDPTCPIAARDPPSGPPGGRAYCRGQRVRMESAFRA